MIQPALVCDTMLPQLFHHVFHVCQVCRADARFTTGDCCLLAHIFFPGKELSGLSCHTDHLACQLLHSRESNGRGAHMEQAGSAGPDEMTNLQMKSNEAEPHIYF
jgi:hypothetical protein